MGVDVGVGVMLAAIQELMKAELDLPFSQWRHVVP